MSLPLFTTRQMSRKDKQQYRKLSNTKLRTIRQSCSWAAYSTSASVSLCSSPQRHCAGEWYLEPDTAHHLPTETCCEADLICLISSVRAGKGSWREDHRTTSLCNYATTPNPCQRKDTWSTSVEALQTVTECREFANTHIRNGPIANLSHSSGDGRHRHP